MTLYHTEDPVSFAINLNVDRISTNKFLLYIPLSSMIPVEDQKGGYWYTFHIQISWKVSFLHSSRETCDFSCWQHSGQSWLRKRIAEWDSQFPLPVGTHSMLPHQPTKPTKMAWCGKSVTHSCNSHSSKYIESFQTLALTRDFTGHTHFSPNSSDFVRVAPEVNLVHSNHAAWLPYTALLHYPPLSDFLIILVRMERCHETNVHFIGSCWTRTGFP